jgi:hypothetical protein
MHLGTSHTKRSIKEVRYNWEYLTTEYSHDESNNSSFSLLDNGESDDNDETLENVLVDEYVDKFGVVDANDIDKNVVNLNDVDSESIDAVVKASNRFNPKLNKSQKLDQNLNKNFRHISQQRRIDNYVTRQSDVRYNNLRSVDITGKTTTPTLSRIYNQKTGYQPYRKKESDICDDNNFKHIVPNSLTDAREKENRIKHQKISKDFTVYRDRERDPLSDIQFSKPRKMNNGHDINRRKDYVDNDIIKDSDANRSKK